MKPIHFLLFSPLLFLVGCSRSGEPTVAVNFDTLQTEFWVESFDILKSNLEEGGFRVAGSVADGDENRQLEQIRNAITRGVDGIIVAPKNDQAILPAIRLANEAGIPIVVYNRPPAEGPGDLEFVTVVADNYSIARSTVEYMVGICRARGGLYKALILIGDLGDKNSIDRRRGFEDALKGSGSFIEVVARIPTDWDQEKARSGIINALQVNPDINFIFTSSDFLLPSIVAALKSKDLYHVAGHPEHVVLGGFDGDATAYGMLKDGYLDATGVQDLYFEAEAATDAIRRLRAGESVPQRIMDPGFVIHQSNLEEKKGRMWGAAVFEHRQP